MQHLPAVFRQFSAFPDVVKFVALGHYHDRSFSEMSNGSFFPSHVEVYQQERLVNYVELLNGRFLFQSALAYLQDRRRRAAPVARSVVLLDMSRAALCDLPPPISDVAHCMRTTSDGCCRDNLRHVTYTKLISTQFRVPTKSALRKQMKKMHRNFETYLKLFLQLRNHPVEDIVDADLPLPESVQVMGPPKEALLGVVSSQWLEGDEVTVHNILTQLHEQYREFEGPPRESVLYRKLPIEPILTLAFWRALRIQRKANVTPISVHTYSLASKRSLGLDFRMSKVQGKWSPCTFSESYRRGEVDVDFGGGCDVRPLDAPVVFGGRERCYPELPNITTRRDSRAVEEWQCASWFRFDRREKTGASFAQWSPSPAFVASSLAAMAKNGSTIIDALQQRINSKSHKDLVVSKSAFQAINNHCQQTQRPLGTVVVSFGVGLAWELLLPQLDSFRAAHRHPPRTAVTALILVISKAANASAITNWTAATHRPGSAGVVVLLDDELDFQNIWDKSTSAETRLKDCKAGVLRYVYLRHLIAAVNMHLGPQFIVHADSRDLLFFSDVSEAVHQQVIESTEATAGHGVAGSREMLMVPLETLPFGSSDMHTIGPLAFNRAWLMNAFTPATFDLVANLSFSPHIDENAHPLMSMPVLCSGLFFGSSSAMEVVFDVMIRLLAVKKSCLTSSQQGTDQGVFNGLVTFGIAAANLSIEVYLLDPRRSKFSQMPEGRHVIWGYSGNGEENKTLVMLNCRNEPYAIVHQLDRLPTLWDNLARFNSWGPSAPQK